MKQSSCLKLGVSLLAAALMGTSATAAGPVNPPTVSNPRVIEITAKRFEFAPNQITIKRGETVKLRLKTEDVTHGFFMRALKIDEEIDPGQVTEVMLTPQVVGTYTTICDH